MGWLRPAREATERSNGDGCAKGVSSWTGGAFDGVGEGVNHNGARMTRIVWGGRGCELDTERIQKRKKISDTLNRARTTSGCFFWPDTRALPSDVLVFLSMPRHAEGLASRRD